MSSGLTIKTVETVEEFLQLPTELQRAALFENMLKIKKQKSCQIDNCEDRFKTIEKRKFWNAAASAGGGVVGGFIAMITYLRFWK